MTTLPRLFLSLALAATAGLAVAALAAPAPAPASVGETRQALADALRDGVAARKRAERLEAEARRVTLQAERTGREAAAVAARIQQAEANIAASRARIRLLARQRRVLRDSLARRQAPIIRLSAALQRLSRRPPALALLRPGSVRDTVYLRAQFETMLPEVERRTAALRGEIARSRALERQAAELAHTLRASEQRLRARQQRLAVIETQQRLASREAAGVASRESERALALAEKARDLGDLAGVMARQATLREALARLPGPVMRPPRPEESRVIEAGHFAAAPQGLSAYQLPVVGRLVAGFGVELAGRPPSRGIVMAVRGGAQVVAPAAGRVAFAGAYRGYGRIVIIEHSGGWTSLVTGLARLDVEVGDNLVGGAPLGIVAQDESQVSLELRRDGEPVNPLQYLKTL